VDVNLLFEEPTIREAKALHAILEKFELATVMYFNKDKSSIFFFNTPVQIQIYLA